ncbi:MAG: hypothetical protein IPL52_06105 [Flavobacteriales bacterium]|nr:hypothetical protein [Flavobacteriales bacterium]
MEELGYMPEYMNTAGVQVLETMEILATSKVLKTIKGRYEFLRQTLPILQTGRSNPRYSLDIQTAIDRYHSMYYDKQPTEEALAALQNPSAVQLPELYSRALLRGLAAHVREENDAIQSLKRADAVTRRKAKLLETVRVAQIELDAECLLVPAYASAKAVLNDLEKQLTPATNQVQS